ncbi:MAG: hypothetical protein LAN62_05695, partial [Acidobacteriia bacterium]|nr:hypothetical protein [Terriglobia bacterium]
DLPAYYAGSAYPCNWGETDQKGFNAAEIIAEAEYAEAEDHEFADHSGDRWIHKATVKRISFPHRPRVKHVWTLGEPVPDYPVNGTDVWLVVRHQKDGEHAAVEHYLGGLFKDGCGLGSRATLEVIPTETVRAGQITEAHGLQDKLAIYAENSGEKVSVGTLDKAAALEIGAITSGQVSAGLHIRIDRLRLRGAIGIWKGLGLDEIELDLNRYDPGLVALVGANGRGKTTLIENMHPYPEMLTRAGKLQDHFRLKDSYRDLHFTDERTGQAYRALIQVDGANTSGRAEYHLYRDGQPLTNGRKEDYEEKVQQLFGSLALFARSAFVSQKPPKNHPDLTDATKGEKKALFRELAGLDYLQAYSEAAREKGKTSDLQIVRDQTREQSLQEQLQAGDDKQQQLEEAQQQEQNNAADLELTAIELKQAQAQREERREAVEANKRLHDQIRAVILRQDGLQQECGKTAAAIADYQKIVALRSVAEQAVLAYDKAKVEEGKLNEERARIASERERRLAEHRDRSEAAHVEDKRLSAEAKMLSRKIAEIEAKKAGFVAKIDQIEVLLQQKTICPKCGHKWADREEERKKELEIVQQNVLDLDLALNPLRKELQQVEAARAAIVFPPEPQLPPIDACDRQLATARRQIEDFHIEQQRALLAKAQDAGARLEEAQRRLVQIGEQQKAAQAEKEGLEAGIDQEAEAAYETADGRVKDLDEQKAAALDVLATVRAQAESLRHADWQYLERACGPDGIQALELDAMGPSIAEVANRLLSAAYGSRFAIEFRTTRIGGAGSKRRQIEDFQIAVLDSEHGTEQLLETLSGGEAVWIKRAIYDAFGIIRDRSTGQRFLTCFQDEADGALDPEARLAYFRMLEAAHLEAGRRHTLVITHSQEAQEMIAQRIRMEDLQPAAAETVETES